MDQPRMVVRHPIRLAVCIVCAWLLLGAAWRALAADYLPPDHGMIDVTTDPHCPGVVGDGVTDVTAALQACITYWGDHSPVLPGITKETHETLFFPAGVYLISDTLRQVGADGTERAYQTPRGAPGAVLRLAPNSAGFQDPNNPRAMWRSGNPGAMGSAALNDILHLRFEIAEGNPGAIAIQYMGNNRVRVEGVEIVAAPLSCAEGISMKEKWPGPAVFDDVLVEGCGKGVVLAYPYSTLLLERLTVRHQRTLGVEVFQMPTSLLNFESVQSIPGVPALRLTGQHEKPPTLTWLIHANLQGAGVGAAIERKMISGSPTGVYVPRYFFRDVNVSGYPFALDSFGTMQATLPAQQVSEAPVSLHLPSPVPPPQAIPDHPHTEHPDACDWVSITEFGAVPYDGIDDVPAIQAAIDSGRKVAYCPAGNWDIGGTIVARGAIERLVGFDCAWVAVGDTMKLPTPKEVLRVETAHRFEVENIWVDREDRQNSPFPEPRTIHAGSGDLVMTHVRHLTEYRSLPGAGTLYTKGGCCDGFELEGNDLVGRMINVEDGPAPLSGDPLGEPDIHLRGDSKGIVVGFKNEGNVGRFWAAEPGTELEVLGGFLYSSIQGGTSQGPIFSCTEANCLFSYTAMSGAKWSSQGRATRNGLELLLPVTATSGGRATMMPLFLEQP